MDKKTTFTPTPVTFETLTEEKINPSHSDLVNKHYWKNEKFNTIYFKRKKQFSADESEVKKEYEIWHKELGNYLFDKENQKFKIKNLSLSERRNASGKIFEFLKFHPNLTIKDEKNLMLIRQEIIDKFFHFSLLNTAIGFSIILLYNRSFAFKHKLALSQAVRKNYFISIGIFFISFVFLDIRFKLKKPYYLIDSLNEKGMTEKYFQDYL